MAEHEKNAPPVQRGSAPGKSPGEEKNKPRRLKFSFCTCGGIPATPPVDLEEIAANQRAVQLAAAHGLEYRYGADLTRLSRYVYPYLEEEDFVFANNWHCCLWVLDNHFDGTDGTLEEKLGLIRRLHSALEKIALGSGAEAPGPQKDAEEALEPARPVVPPSEARARAFVGLLGAALRPVLRRLGPRLRQHMTTQVAEYFRGVEDHLLCDEDTLTLDEYAAIRVADSAYETVWPLMYLGLGDLLDLGEASARGLRRRANQCGRIINDVYSVPKDRAAGVKFNAVFILARELGISDAQAEKILVARANKLFRELPGTGKFSGFRLWCAGAAVWHDIAERYRDPGARPADESAAKTKAESGASNTKYEIPAKGQSLAAVLFSTSVCPEWAPTSDDEYSGYN